MNPYELMELKKDSFTKNELMIYEYVKENAYEIFRGTIVDMAVDIGVSQPAITRFCQKLGYDNFSSFKMHLYKAEKQALSDKNDVEMSYQVLESYKKLISKLDTVINKEELESFAKSIIKARRVFTIGTHKSRLSAELLKYNLMKFGINCNSFSSDDRHELINVANKDDLVIVISANCESTKGFIKEIFNEEMKVALITMNSKVVNKSSYEHYIWLPNSKNQNEKIYTENTVVFSVFIDLLTSFVAKEINS
ncbi:MULTISPECIES: MurR/RpiR family transcriptional regulator [Clostridium]|uniref:MurR/RpiR family transcriptional regulator n=1 Tax=Clostridium TaxID=1485 RepID=UPI001898225C|nr:MULTISPECIES: MurR/RpiR family transcriptional regulator [Clostridium]MDB2109339.1 MurR/RpiR family transcriptional regulator [Clostridium paraputrificum]MDB2125519.1 MurR/RpiR family transcriptional regulator [Clostridium paraputrificum]MDU6521295.1 MurR/RpiR family transcriptional regulator [Clostridium sp.]